MSRGEYRDIRPRRLTAKSIRVAEAGKLVVLRGGEIGRRYTLEDEVTIGRAPGSGILLDDFEVSRQHAKITRGAAGLFIIVDVGSRNGIFVNGERLQEKVLEFGDRIEIGAHEFLFSRYSPEQSQILERQRVETLGRLSAGLAHDFNNMLAVISASRDYLVGLLAELPAVDPEVTECVNDIEQATNHAQGLAARMLALSRSQDRGHQRVDVGEICQELGNLLRGSMPRVVTIETQTEPRLLVAGDSVELYQMVMNLMLNARDAMPEGGALTVSARRDREYRRVCVEVRDTGVGMDEATRKKIFEPFFSTKSEKGFGLGLSTVREIVVTHGGSIDVESEPGEGTTFFIELPALATEMEVAGDRITIPPPGEHAALQILLVDDEPLVRKSIARILVAAGHEVTMANDGREALEAYTAADPRPTLVVLDLDMPRLDGVQTLRRLRELDPSVRAVITSGKVTAADEKLLTAAGAAGVLRKPCRSDELLAMIERVFRQQADTIDRKENVLLRAMSPTLRKGDKP
ncbi:MAG: response regulator [Deltaproteobacteria bacterium]|jgi:signal transduction histidine kinase/FixJ family two-component response regulator|nr:response regulator [Deltaproteobacteria bacterium]MBW2537315.1 response regulator [Deltaproteobacteria bacterium]